MNILMDIFVNFNPSQELFEMMRDQLIKDYVNQLKNPHNILRQVYYFVWISVFHRLKQKPSHSALHSLLQSALIQESNWKPF